MPVRHAQCAGGWRSRSISRSWQKIGRRWMRSTTPRSLRVEGTMDRPAFARTTTRIIAARLYSIPTDTISRPYVTRRLSGRAAAAVLRQPRLRQSIDDALEIARLLVGQHALALREREGRIDFHQLRPRRARLVYAPEMTVAGGDQHAARIGGGGAGDPLYELLGGRAVIAQAEIRLRHVMQHDARIVRVEPHRGCEPPQRLGRVPGIHQHQPRCGIALGEVRIELEHAAKLGERAVVIA